MKILISLILSLIFIIPVFAQEKSDVGPNYSEEQIQELLNTVQEGVECQIVNNSLAADLTYYKVINSVLKAPEPEVLAKIEEKIIFIKIIMLSKNLYLSIKPIIQLS